MHAATLTFLFFVGLAVGSFINVLSLRYRIGSAVFTLDTLIGRSHCRKCKRILSWHELVPLLSFLMQWGKCRSCKVRLSWQYPIVEFITGVLFVAVPIRLNVLFGQTPRLLLGETNFVNYAAALWLLLTFLLVLIAVIDFRERVIPDELNVAVALAGVLYVILQSVTDTFGHIEGSLMGRFALVLGARSDIIINHVYAVLFGIIFFGLIIVVSRGAAMGMGDLKLAAAAGVFLGWPDIVFALALSFVIGSLFSIFLILGKKKTMKDAVPFAPYIAMGIFTILFFGQAVLEGYFGFFGF